MTITQRERTVTDMKVHENDSTDAYLGTVNRIEPDVAILDRDGSLASIAISLKRIADLLEKAFTEAS